MRETSWDFSDCLRSRDLHIFIPEEASLTTGRGGSSECDVCAPENAAHLRDLFLLLFGVVLQDTQNINPEVLDS